ncbi:serine O-acetyltransferase [Niveibacterium sp. SC-1]|uniref:serine O-acetyltransferase n=1 Tax=Niveibacterium sp. SC-1 TaxID=3135646 RepID=UPI0031200FAA
MSAEQTAMEPSAQARPTPAPGLFAMLREDVACVFQRDPAARSRIEVLTIYPGVQALVLHRIAHALWGGGLCYLARLLAFLSRFLTNIDIHPGARIGRRFFIDHGAGVVIGETAEIGDDVTLYHGVTLGGTTWSPGKRHPTLGDGVVVGAGAKVLGAIRIGDRARVAANSVVIEDVMPGMTVVGIPGRMVLPRSQRRIAEHGIDLDHHQMPDPVGKAIACLLERIDALEGQLAQVRPSTLGTSIPTPSNASQREGQAPCAECFDCVEACSQPPFDESPEAVEALSGACRHE